jgi:tetratricopeptide (TPR) repeat protein
VGGTELNKSEIGNCTIPALENRDPEVLEFKASGFLIFGMRQSSNLRSQILIVSLLAGIVGGIWIAFAYYSRKTPSQNELFAEALKFGQSAPERTYILREVAKAQARAGDYDRALATALQLRLNRFSGDAVAEIVRIRVAQHDIAGAKEMVSRLPENNLNNGARREIALAQAANGDLDGALRTTNGRFAGELRDALANARLRTGDYEAALSTITQRVSPDEVHDDVLYGIAREMIQHGDRRRAQLAIERIRDPEIKTAAIPTALEDALASHNLDDARIEARRLPALERSDALLDIAKQLIAAGRMDDASSALAEAAAAAEPGVLRRIAVLQIDSGLPVDALPSLKKLRSNLCEVAWAYARKRRFHDADDLEKDGCRVIAEEQYRAGDIDGAIARTRSEPNPSDQSAGFADLAKLAAKNGDVTHARRFVELVRVPGAHQEGEGYLAPALREVTRAWAKTGKSYEAYRWARARGTAYERAMAVLGVAEAVQ